MAAVPYKLLPLSEYQELKKEGNCVKLLPPPQITNIRINNITPKMRKIMKRVLSRGPLVKFKKSLFKILKKVKAILVAYLTTPPPPPPLGTEPHHLQ